MYILTYYSHINQMISIKPELHKCGTESWKGKRHSSVVGHLLIVL